MGTANRLLDSESSLLAQVMGNDEAIRAQFRAMQSTPVVFERQPLTLKEQDDRLARLRYKPSTVGETTTADLLMGGVR